MHEIEYKNDSYLSRMVNFVNNNVVSDSKIEEVLVKYTKQIIQGLENILGNIK